MPYGGGATVALGGTLGASAIRVSMVSLLDSHAAQSAQTLRRRAQQDLPAESPTPGGERRGPEDSGGT